MCVVGEGPVISSVINDRPWVVEPLGDERSRERERVGGGGSESLYQLGYKGLFEW